MLESTTTKTIMTIDTQEVGQARRHQDPCRDAHAPHTPHTSNADKGGSALANDLRRGRTWRIFAPPDFFIHHFSKGNHSS